MSNRKIVPLKETESALEDVREALDLTLYMKGPGGFASRHEILGVLCEEFEEYREAVHRGRTGRHLQREELLDIAVAAVFGIASMDSGTTDW